MNTNELNRRIEIYNRQKIKNNFGEYEYTNKLYCTAWAKIERSSSENDNKELQNLNKLVNRSTLKITIRYLNNLQDNMYIKYRKKFYKIENIDNLDQKDEFLKITCEKIED